MKFNQLNETVDVSQYPAKIEKSKSNNTQLIVGDLHGSALKLLFILVKHEVIEISPSAYAKLNMIYSKLPTSLTKEDINQFKTILEQAKFHKSTSISMIGDCFADRGSNDLFTLLILQQLTRHNIPYEVLLSNHDADFIYAYETQDNFTPCNLMPVHAQSMHNLQAFIEKRLIDVDTVKSMATNCYKPHLKLISYSLSDNGKAISISSHAGIGIDNIRYLANKLGVRFDDRSAINLAQTIDNINSSFKANFVDRNKVNTLLDRTMIRHGYSGSPFTSEQQMKYPLEFIMWNRHYADLNRASLHKGYLINYIHGHDLSDPSKNNIYNVDNTLAKDISMPSGEYNIIVCENSVNPLNKLAKATPKNSLARPSSRLSASSSSSSSPTSHSLVPYYDSIHRRLSTRTPRSVTSSRPISSSSPISSASTSRSNARGRSQSIDSNQKRKNVTTKSHLDLSLMRKKSSSSAAKPPKSGKRPKRK